MLSYETAKTTLTLQYYRGEGFQGGGTGENEGFSVFAEACIPFTPLTIFGRFDHFAENLPETLPNAGQEIMHSASIGGIAWKFYKNNRLLIDIEKSYAYSPGDAWSSSLDVIYDKLIAELALEIVF
jgi:hypothetical protein